MNRQLIKGADKLVTPVGFSAIHGKEMNNLKIIDNPVVYIEDGIIRMVGTQSEIIPHLKEEFELIDVDGGCLVPGFVDSHTHFVFGGYRPDEFVERLGGTPYLEILANGGGIQSTVLSTKSDDEQRLYNSGRERLDEMLRQGITTVEGKSGYGLDLETELKQLNVMTRLNENHSVDIVKTYLGAHAVPEKMTADDYIDYIISEVLPKVKDSAEFCDVFCEEGVFSTAQSEKLLSAGKGIGLRAKIHADEIVSLGGAELSVDIKAVSADHLLAVSDEGIKKLAESETIATLLPCTAFCLNKPFAPARKMIDNGCAVALASDYNPGSCFTNNISLLLALGVISMGMTIEEAITAITLNGAVALGRADITGSIEPGKQADIVILNKENYKFLVYNTVVNQVKGVIKYNQKLRLAERVV